MPKAKFDFGQVPLWPIFFFLCGCVVRVLCGCVVLCVRRETSAPLASAVLHRPPSATSAPIGPSRHHRLPSTSIGSHRPPLEPALHHRLVTCAGKTEEAPQARSLSTYQSVYRHNSYKTMMVLHVQVENWKCLEWTSDLTYCCGRGRVRSSMLRAFEFRTHVIFECACRKFPGNLFRRASSLHPLYRRFNEGITCEDNLLSRELKLMSVVYVCRVACAAPCLASGGGPLVAP